MDDDSLLGPDEGVYDFDDDTADAELRDDVQFAVRLQDVTREYDLGTRKILALQGINLEIRPGEFVVIRGHSGSGKTTLLNLIGGIDYPTNGRVVVMDVPIGDYDESFRASFRLNNTGFIFQSYNLISTLTTLENVMFPMQLTDKGIPELEKEAIRLLRKVDMEERVDHLPWQLSSGEQQRVAIARALSNDPPIILADEPTANLDVESGQMIRNILTELHTSGKTIIVMTHDSEIMNLNGIRSLVMKNGELFEIG